MVAMGPLGGVKEGGGGGGASGIGAKFVAASKKNSSSVSPVSSWLWKSADRGEGSNGSNGDFGVLLWVSIFVDYRDANPYTTRVHYPSHGLVDD